MAADRQLQVLSYEIDPDLFQSSFYTAGYPEFLCVRFNEGGKKIRVEALVDLSQPEHRSELSVISTGDKTAFHPGSLIGSVMHGLRKEMFHVFHYTTQINTDPKHGGKHPPARQNVGEVPTA